jgi:hypothetical protein
LSSIIELKLLLVPDDDDGACESEGKSEDASPDVVMEYLDDNVIEEPYVRLLEDVDVLSDSHAPSSSSISGEPSSSASSGTCSNFMLVVLFGRDLQCLNGSCKWPKD